MLATTQLTMRPWDFGDPTCSSRRRLCTLWTDWNISWLSFCTASLSAFFLTSATVTVMLLPREPEAKEEKAEGVAISSARTLATIYLIDKKLDKAEDFEI